MTAFEPYIVGCMVAGLLAYVMYLVTRAAYWSGYSLGFKIGMDQNRKDRL